MYVNQKTSAKIQNYIDGHENLQHLIRVVGAEPTEGGPCADFVRNLIEAATLSHIESPASVFNKDVNLLAGGSLILNAEQLERCTTGDILAIVENVKDRNQRVVHYMLYVNPKHFEEINAIGVNGCLEYVNCDPFKGVVAEFINTKFFTPDGEFHYGSRSHYNLWCIDYNLFN